MLEKILEATEEDPSHAPEALNGLDAGQAAEAWFRQLEES
jgi:hypothetical protein